MVKNHLCTLLFILTTISINSQNLDWVNSIGGSQDEIARDLIVDFNGNTYVVGQFSGTVDFDPSSTSTVAKTSNGNADVFILKLDSNGNFVWVQTFGGTNADNASAVKIDNSGNIVLVGTFLGTVDFNPLNSSTAFSTSNGARDMYLLKLNIAGEYIFHQTFGGTGNDYMLDVAIDINNNYVTTGSFVNTVDFDPTSGSSLVTSGSTEGDIFVAKFSPSNGNLVWAKRFFGNSGTRDSAGTCIAVDIFNNIITGGYYAGVVDFDPSNNVANESSNYKRNMFISKLDSNGDFVFVRSVDNDSKDDRIRDLKLDSEQNIIATGNFAGPNVDFSFGAGATVLNGNGGAITPFISKTSSSGGFVWAKEFNTTAATGNNGFGVTIDTADNIFMSGQFSLSIDLDPGNSTNSVTTAGAIDAFMVKLDKQGAFIWGKSFGGANNETPYAIQFYDNKLYQAGRFNGTSDFNPDNTEENRTAIGGYDFFVQRFSENSLSIENNSKLNLSLFPNPASDYIYLRNLNSKHFKIYSIQGKLVKADTYKQGDKINVSNLSKGFYYISFIDETSKKQINKKFLKF